MTTDQWLISGIVVATLALFVWGRYRYDVVALAALLAATGAGLVPAGEAFLGFGHPATVTVAAVLVISRALANSGAVDAVTRLVVRAAKHPGPHVAILSGLAAVLSTMMNNVGALALLMPVALESVKKVKRAPAVILMPLSFGSILGGLATMIGTPPNIIVATYRAEVADAPFTMFDFTPVGATLAIAGVAFVALIGWRLIPASRKQQGTVRDLLNIEDYVTDVQVPEGSGAVDNTVRDLEDGADDHGTAIVGLIRGGRRILNRLRQQTVRAGDADSLANAMARLGCLPLAGRALQMGKRGQAGAAVAIFAAAIATGSLGLTSLPVALAAAAALMVLINVVPVREIYDAIDWPVIVLLGAMIPVAGALESSGALGLVNAGLLSVFGGLPAWALLAVIMVVTMTLSDIMNNAATAVVMAPLGAGIAAGLGVDADPFLMAVAVGASCAFLTPIGHQNNTLVMGPGATPSATTGGWVCRWNC